MKKVLIIGLFSLAIIVLFISEFCPPIHRWRIDTRAAAALTSLRVLEAQEAIWKQQDIDGNGINDYWTYDISCFNRMYRADGQTKVGFIDIAFARADTNPATDMAFLGNPAIEPWIGDTIDASDAATLTSKSGYLFRAMLTDENGVPYNQNPVGAQGVKVCNSTKFAFVAYPEAYGTSGVNTFIVNESGTVYCTDCGSGDGAKIVLQWPGENPADVIGPGGRRWAPAE
ncbi:MAG: DUF2950 family protein [Planctomycetes bacterium]|nr:DUF2950 family protein [Planctomycetota bacterium]